AQASESGTNAHLARVVPSEADAGHSDCDLVIEAVLEHRDIKAEVWGRIHAAHKPDAIRASNTSTLPITGLAQYVKDRSSFIGIHFFSPVDKMQLVEIIQGKSTSDRALPATLDFVAQIRT